jgi:hypothetical protein
MGDRGQIKLVGTDGDNSGNIFFYTHWGATDLPATLADALDRGRGRWDDTCYLNRIIFSEMIKDHILGDTGYGICTDEHGDTWRMIEINHTDQSVSIFEKDEFDSWKPHGRYDYQEFINEFSGKHI